MLLNIGHIGHTLVWGRAMQFCVVSFRGDAARAIINAMNRMCIESLWFSAMEDTAHGSLIVSRFSNRKHATFSIIWCKRQLLSSSPLYTTLALSGCIKGIHSRIVSSTMEVRTIAKDQRGMRRIVYKFLNQCLMVLFFTIYSRRTR